MNTIYCLNNVFDHNVKLSPTNFFHSHTEKTGELPTSLPMGCTWATEWAASGLPMGILPCKLGCPLLPYMETVGSSVGSSVGSPLLPNMKKVGSSVGSGVGCRWAAHGNFDMQIRLPTTSIYGNSGQPTTFKYENNGQFSGQPTDLPTIKFKMDAILWGVEWAVHVLPMGILPCKLGYPLLPYTDIVGSSVGNSVGSPLLSSMKIMGSLVGNPLNCPLLNLKWTPSFIHMQDICSTCI